MGAGGSQGGSALSHADRHEAGNSMRPSKWIEAIQEHLDDLEDLYLAEQRLIDLRAGKSRTVSLDEVMKRYGLDDTHGRHVRSRSRASSVRAADQ